MTYTLKFEHPHFPDGYLFGVSGLGEVKNGGTLEVDEDMERGYVAARGVTMEDAFANSAEITLSGSSSLDPTELEQLVPEPVRSSENETAPVVADGEENA